MTERERPASPSELEGGGDEQTWGQGEGRHEATIPDDDEQPTTRAPRPDGPMFQPTDQADASDELAESPSAAYGQREGRADSETGDQAG